MTEVYTVKKLREIRKALEDKRKPWEKDWKSLRFQLMPLKAMRFDSYDWEKIEGFLPTQIMNSIPALAVVRSVSGMMSVITNESQPWFNLRRPIGVEEVYSDSKELEDNTKVIRHIFKDKGFYKIMGKVYQNLLVYGFSCIGINNDMKMFSVDPFDIWIDSYNPSILMKKCVMSVHELLNRFGYENLCQQTRQIVDSNKDIFQAVIVWHYVYRYGNKYVSVYMEDKVPDMENKFLSIRTIEDMPYICSRIEVDDEKDLYGSYSPGLRCLNEIIELQQMQMNIKYASNEKARPSVQADPSLKIHESRLKQVSTFIYRKITKGTEYVRQLYDVKFNALELREDKMEAIDNIRKAFNTDIYELFINLKKSRTTQEEILQKREEKLLSIGPQHGMIEAESLKPLILYYVKQYTKKGVIQFSNDEIKVPDIQYDTLVTRALKSIDVSSTEELVVMMERLFKLNPQVMDIFNLDEIARNYRKAKSLPVDYENPEDIVNQIRTTRQEQQQRQMNLQETKLKMDSISKMMNKNQGGADLPGPQ